MCQEIEIGNSLAVRQKDGTFLYKSKDVVLKQPKVKSSYRDKPQFKVIEDIEGSIKKNLKTMVTSVGIDVIKFLKTI